MKTTKSLFGTMAMSIVAMFLTANLYADVYLYVRPLKTSKKAIVELSIPILNTVSIYVFNEKGQLIHNENIKEGSSYKRIYDFSEVETGMYTIISDSKFLKVTKEIKVDDTSIEVLSTKYLHRPVFTVKDEILTINYLNKALSDVEISIEDPYYTYYKEKLSSNMLFKKSFDLHKLSPGEYTVLVKANRCEFACNIIKNHQNQLITDF